MKSEIIIHNSVSLDNSLTGFMPEMGLSLLVHPLIVGENCYAMFSDVKANLNLKLKKSEQFENGCIWLVYSVGDPASFD